MPPADLVLADPPYGFAGWADLLMPLVAPSSSPSPASRWRLRRGWERVREKRYGRTVVTFLRRVDELP